MRVVHRDNECFLKISTNNITMDYAVHDLNARCIPLLCLIYEKSKVKMATKKLLDSFSKTAELGTRLDMEEAEPHYQRNHQRLLRIKRNSIQTHLPTHVLATMLKLSYITIRSLYLCRIKFYLIRSYGTRKNVLDGEARGHSAGSYRGYSR